MFPAVRPQHLVSSRRTPARPPRAGPPLVSWGEALGRPAYPPPQGSRRGGGAPLWNGVGSLLAGPGLPHTPKPRVWKCLEMSLERMPYSHRTLPSTATPLALGAPFPKEPGPGCQTFWGGKGSLQGAESPRRGFGDRQRLPPHTHTHLLGPLRPQLRASSRVVTAAASLGGEGEGVALLGVARKEGVHVVQPPYQEEARAFRMGVWGARSRPLRQLEP